MNQQRLGGSRRFTPALLMTFALTVIVSCAGASGFSPQPPDLRGEPKLWVPAFSTKRLSNGLTVHVNPDPYLPMVSIAVGIRGGYLLDPPSKAGLTHLMVANLLTRTERFDRMTLAASYDTIGAPVRTQVMADGIVLTLGVLEDRASGALKLLAEVLSRPGFEAAEVERTRLEQLANLENGLGQPATAALWGLRQVIFGTKHPMGLPPLGTRSSIAGLTLEDLQTRARQVLRPDQVVLVVAGRVDTAAVEDFAQTLFGSWTTPSGAADPAKVIAQMMPADAGPAPADRKKVFYIPQTGASQTTVVVGRRGVPMSDPGHYLLRLVAGRAPAGASAWLRGKEQVTYGVSGLGDANSNTGYFGAQLSVDTPATGMALDSIIGRYGARLPGSFDLEKVVLLASEGMAFYSLSGRTSAVARQHVSGLPLDHFAQLRQRIDDQREGEIQNILDTFIDDDSMQVVLVGDEAALRAQIPATNLGDLTPLDLAAMH